MILSLRPEKQKTQWNLWLCSTYTWPKRGTYQRGLLPKYTIHGYYAVGTHVAGNTRHPWPSASWRPVFLEVDFLTWEVEIPPVCAFAGWVWIRDPYASSSRASRGRKFQKKKKYIAKKEFAYRMCARRPTSAMPKPFLCCAQAFCCSTVVMWPVLMSWNCLRGEMQ